MPTPFDAVLARAALLRAAGCSWESVAAQLGRPVEALLKWPDKYPDRWAAALAEAERRVATEASSEAVLILRQLLRAKDEKVRRDAARFLIDLRYRHVARAARPGTPTSPRSADARRLVAFLEAHSDDELEVLAAQVLTPPLALPAAEAGPVDVPGPE
jgi:hypothetical protein